MMRSLFLFSLLLICLTTITYGQEKSNPVLKAYTKAVCKVFVNGSSISKDEIFIKAKQGEVQIGKDKLLKGNIIFSLDTLTDNNGNSLNTGDAVKYFTTLSDSLKTRTFTIDFSGKKGDEIALVFTVNNANQIFNSRYHLVNTSDRWAIFIEPVNLKLNFIKSGGEQSPEVVQVSFNITVLK